MDRNNTTNIKSIKSYEIIDILPVKYYLYSNNNNFKLLINDIKYLLTYPDYIKKI